MQFSFGFYSGLACALTTHVHTNAKAKRGPHNPKSGSDQSQIPRNVSSMNNLHRQVYGGVLLSTNVPPPYPCLAGCLDFYSKCVLHLRFVLYVSRPHHLAIHIFWTPREDSWQFQQTYHLSPTFSKSFKQQTCRYCSNELVAHNSRSIIMIICKLWIMR